MKKLILQHYTGTPGELERLSMVNIQRLADREGADYQFLQGNVFSDALSPPMQKLAILSERFDHFDVVVMLDTDMFTHADLSESLFAQPGIGVSGPSQRRLKWAFIRKMKGLLHWRYPYWCGSLWKLDRLQRQKFREKLHLVDLERYNHGRLEDEGVMHQLARHNGYRGKLLSLPEGDKWSCASWRNSVADAAMIHVRLKMTEQGGKRPKIENLRSLVERGLINV